MMPQQRMVAPGTPMMRTPTPRPMNQGGIVQAFAPGGSVRDCIDPAIVDAYEDSLASVQADIAERQANIIPDAVAVWYID